MTAFWREIRTGFQEEASEGWAFNSDVATKIKGTDPAEGMKERRNGLSEDGMNPQAMFGE